jgi:hypothetical protein
MRRGVPLGIENAVFLENLCDDGDGGVDGVGDDEDKGFGGGGGDAGSEVPDDAGVDLGGG